MFSRWHYRLRSRCSDYLIYINSGSLARASLGLMKAASTISRAPIPLDEKSARFINVRCDTINLFHQNVRRDAILLPISSSLLVVIKITFLFSFFHAPFSSFDICIIELPAVLLPYDDWIIYCQFVTDNFSPFLKIFMLIHNTPW